jgi:hypothetical protein
MFNLNKIKKIILVKLISPKNVIQALGLVRIYMFTNKKRLVKQLGLFEKPWILIMKIFVVTFGGDSP